MNINQQIAIKGAELSGWNLKVISKLQDLAITDGIVVSSTGETFDPVNNANDMNKIIEALKMSVVYNLNQWNAYVPDCDIVFNYESRDEAIRECVIKALGVDNG